MPTSEVRWMNSRREILRSSAALPLETRLRRYNSNTISSRAVCSIGEPRVTRKPLRSSPRSRILESITDLLLHGTAHSLPVTPPKPNQPLPSLSLDPSHSPTPALPVLLL